jgi:hypothetical protein
MKRGPVPLLGPALLILSGRGPQADQSTGRRSAFSSDS